MVRCCRKPLQSDFTVRDISVGNSDEQIPNQISHAISQISKHKILNL